MPAGTGRSGCRGRARVPVATYDANLAPAGIGGWQPPLACLRRPDEEGEVRIHHGQPGTSGGRTGLVGLPVRMVFRWRSNQSAPATPPGGRGLRCRGILPITEMRRRARMAVGAGPGRRAMSLSALVSLMLAALLFAGASLAAGSGATVIRTHHTHFGRMVANSHGLSLYVYCVYTGRSGRTGPIYNCDGKGVRLQGFPPLFAGSRVVAAAHSGIRSAHLGTRRLANGKHQVAYYGQRLFRYTGDKRPGQTNGLGGNWELIDPAGNWVGPMMGG